MHSINIQSADTNEAVVYAALKRKVFIFNMLIYFAPFGGALILLSLSRVISIPDLIALLISPVVLVILPLYFAIPIFAYRYFIKKIEVYDGSDESHRASSASAKHYIVFTLIFPLIISSFISALALVVNGSRDPVFISALTFMVAGAICLFSIFFFVFFLQALEHYLKFIPLKREHSSVSFLFRTVGIAYYGMAGTLLVSTVPLIYLLADHDHDAWFLVPIIFIGLAISLAYMMLEFKSISRRINAIADFARGLASGDYRRDTLPVHSRDELGFLVNDMNMFFEKTKGLLTIITNNTDSNSTVADSLSTNMTETAGAINQISAAIENINDQILNQAAGVNETQGNIKQISGTIQKMDEHIEMQASAVSESSASVEQMVANIRSVTNILEKNSEAVTRLQNQAEESKHVVEKSLEMNYKISSESEGLLEASNVIQHIASQTNLLAMNAAIEAAHAGDFGRGFAVVADEIRKLAEESSLQGKNIGAVLKSLKSTIDFVVDGAESVKKQFESIYELTEIVKKQENVIMNAMREQNSGSEQVLEAIRQIYEITALVKDGSAQMLGSAREADIEMNKLADVTQAISSRMNEMAAGTVQINESITEVNEITQQNRDGLHQLAAETSKFKL